jgi:hypothetical protein
MTDVPHFVQTLFEQLRRRRFPIGIDDYVALRQTLQMGFGLASHEELRALCCALWAKSEKEQSTLITLFNQLNIEHWEVSVDAIRPPQSGAKSSAISEHKPAPSDMTGSQDSSLEVQSFSGLPPLPGGIALPERSFVFVPQFPLTYREIAQAWRRLRSPQRTGPPVDLDLEATIDQRCQQGVSTEIVLVPRRRNTARLLLLVDRQGSMTPFQQYIDEVCNAIIYAGQLESVARFYFHDVPVDEADETVLESLSDQLRPTLDSILHEIKPCQEGMIYNENDPDLLLPEPLTPVLEEFARDAAVVIISDAGAARGRYDVPRLLNTVAFLKALRRYTSSYVWMNPLPGDYWKRSTAAQIARHAVMLPLDSEGMYRAVNVLRGQPYVIERPL